jgi:hypothetical protein
LWQWRGVGEYKRAGGEIVKSKLVEQTVFRRANTRLEIRQQRGDFELYALAQRAPCDFEINAPLEIEPEAPANDDVKAGLVGVTFVIRPVALSQVMLK